MALTDGVCVCVLGCVQVSVSGALGAPLQLQLTDGKGRTAGVDWIMPPASALQHGSLSPPLHDAAQGSLSLCLLACQRRTEQRLPAVVIVHTSQPWPLLTAEFTPSSSSLCCVSCTCTCSC